MKRKTDHLAKELSPILPEMYNDPKTREDMTEQFIKKRPNSQMSPGFKARLHRQILKAIDKKKGEIHPSAVLWGNWLKLFAGFAGGFLIFALIGLSLIQNNPLKSLPYIHIPSPASKPDSAAQKKAPEKFDDASHQIYQKAAENSEVLPSPLIYSPAVEKVVDSAPAYTEVENGGLTADAITSPTTSPVTPPSVPTTDPTSDPITPPETSPVDTSPTPQTDPESSPLTDSTPPPSSAPTIPTAVPAPGRTSDPLPETGTDPATLPENGDCPASDSDSDPASDPTSNPDSDPTAPPLPGRTSDLPETGTDPATLPENGDCPASDSDSDPASDPTATPLPGRTSDPLPEAGTDPESPPETAPNLNLRTPIKVEPTRSSNTPPRAPRSSR